jgi:hypothetical protein
MEPTSIHPCSLPLRESPWIYRNHEWDNLLDNPTEDYPTRKTFPASHLQILLLLTLKHRLHPLPENALPLSTVTTDHEEEEDEDPFCNDDDEN